MFWYRTNPQKICDVCLGAGRVKGRRSLKIEIRASIEDGQIIKIKAMGEAGERGAEAGDVYAQVKIKPHPIFVRQGDDLLIEKEVRFIDLFLGRKIEVPTISGNKLQVEVPTDWDLKTSLRLPGEGMPYFGLSGRGFLVVRLRVKTPKKISPKAKKILEDIEKELD